MAAIFSLSYSGENGTHMCPIAIYLLIWPILQTHGPYIHVFVNSLYIRHEWFRGQDMANLPQMYGGGFGTGDDCVMV